MRNPPFYSSAPVVDLTEIELSRLTGGISDPMTGWQHFSLGVTWLREARATVRLVHRGVEVKELSNWVDTHQFLGCHKPALEAAASAAAHYRVSPDSELLMQVDLTVLDSPYVRAPEEDSSILESPAYHRLEAVPSQAVWHTDRGLMDTEWGHADTAGRNVILEHLSRFWPEPREAARHEAIWSSQGGLKAELSPAARSTLDELAANMEDLQLQVET